MGSRVELFASSDAALLCLGYIRGLLPPFFFAASPSRPLPAMDALRSIAKKQSNGNYEIMELFIKNLEKAGVSRAAQLVELCEDGIEQLLSGVFPDMLPVEYPPEVLVTLRDWAGILPKIADMEARRGRG